MKQVILLSTGWKPDYWKLPKEAPYPKRSYKDLPKWEELSKNCPLPGLGIYIKQKERDFRENQFEYLKITGMRYDPHSGQPFFTFEPIKESHTKSKDLTNRLPVENQKKLFSAIDAKQLIKILNEIGEKPPKEWRDLIESVEPTTVSWRNYIGGYFLKIESDNISNDDFEDRVAALLTALGFNTTQKGYRFRGEFADGLAEFDDYIIVYDCKNRFNYIPSAQDKRAIEKYFEDEGKVHKEKQLHKAFIAKSFAENQKNNIFYFPVNALLYLLYKKLIIGFKFSLSPFRKILDNNLSITIKTINEEWYEK